DVVAGREPPPGAAFELPPGEPGAQRLADRERSALQLLRDDRRARHAPSIQHVPRNPVLLSGTVRDSTFQPPLKGGIADSHPSASRSARRTAPATGSRSARSAGPRSAGPRSAPRTPHPTPHSHTPIPLPPPPT